jgi:hypothetical protein
VSETRRLWSCEVGSPVGSCEVGSRLEDSSSLCEVKDGSTIVGFWTGVEELMGDIPGSRGKAGEKASMVGTIGSGSDKVG